MGKKTEKEESFGAAKKAIKKERKRRKSEMQRRMVFGNLKMKIKVILYTDTALCSMGMWFQLHVWHRIPLSLNPFYVP